MLDRPEKEEFDHASSILYFTVPNISSRASEDEGQRREV
jgi:hypothetical protein